MFVNLESSIKIVRQNMSRLCFAFFTRRTVRSRIRGEPLLQTFETDHRCDQPSAATKQVPHEASIYDVVGLYIKIDL